MCQKINRNLSPQKETRRTVKSRHNIIFEDTTKHCPIDPIKGGHWRFRNLAKVDYEIELILQHFYIRISFDRVCKIAI